MYDLRDDVEFSKRYDEAFGTKKGNVMNDDRKCDDKLECLRLAIEWAKVVGQNCDILGTARILYNWISEADKPNSLTFEKINQERK